MITKQELAEQILLLLGRTEPGFRIDIREILLSVGQERDSLLVQEYAALRLSAAKTGEAAPGVPPAWLTPFVAKVEHDEARKRDFVQLPFEPLALPDGVGLFSLAPAADEFNPYVPTRPGELSLLSHHPGFTLGGRVGYWREMGAEAQPGKAWFQRRILTGSPTVLGLGVCPSASIGSRAPFPISSHLQPQLIDLVRQRYATKPAPVPA